jgi:LmbE family N-acetylglucosaminyl deacetylase
MVAFTHLEPGTSERVWQADGRIREAPPLDADVDDLVVVAAHPDDETMGAGGLIRRIHATGGRVTVVVASDGEASHPRSVSHTRTDLRSIRRAEVTRAVRALAPAAEVRFLGLPDGGLRENAAALDEALEEILGTLPSATPRTLIVAPWSGDGHRDHRIAAESAARVAGRRGVRHVGYPIWLWHWGQPADVPWDRGTALTLNPCERAIKTHALRTHVSQLQPLSDAPGDEAIVPAEMQAHFTRDTEVFFAEAGRETNSLPVGYFDAFYARHDDPWGFETRWYEERKRALLLASLPTRELGAVLEIGCSTGLITVELAARADHVTALEPAVSALETARTRTLALHNVTLRRGVAPDDWPAGEFDTVVLSEVGYYLSPDDLQRTIALIDSAMAADGCVVACHWRHPVADYPQTGDQVHAALRCVPSWERIARHEEEDFLLEVFGRRPVASVARREGLQ